MDFAQEIIAIRTKNQLTQTAFAKRINVCPASIRGWESGQYRPSVRRLEAIDRAFNTNLADQAIAETPGKARRRRTTYQELPAFTDDVEVFKSVITLLKLFMLLNQEGREKAIRKITSYAYNKQYQIPRMHDNADEITATLAAANATDTTDSAESNDTNAHA